MKSQPLAPTTNDRQSDTTETLTASRAICAEIAELRTGVQEALAGEVEFFRKLSYVVLSAAVIGYAVLLLVLLRIAG